MDDLTKKFLGSSFFYDTFFFKTTAYNSGSNFFCVYAAIKIFKPWLHKYKYLGLKAYFVGFEYLTELLHHK